MSNTSFDKFEMKKVQEVKGSFYIYLPKSWCRKYNVAEDKRVYLKQLADDSILVRSDTTSPELLTTYVINLDNENDGHEDLDDDEYIDYIFNLYLTAYIIGYHTIKLEKQDKIPTKIKNRIHKLTQKLYGMVVISEGRKEIVVEEHFDEVNIQILTKQILNKVGLLIGNYIEIVQDYDKIEDINDELDELIEQDNQIDEHRYAIERYVHQILNFPSLGRNINVTSVECLHFSETTRLIERIGDYITKLAVVLKTQPMTDVQFVKEHLRTMQQTFHTIQDFFWRKDSLKLWRLTQKIKKYAVEVKQKIYENHEDTEYLIPIRRISVICGDIAEIRINDILSKQQAQEVDKNSKSDKN
ncbi:MAG: PhoU domain-containing protein [Promethearchaeota archaeon]